MLGYARSWLLTARHEDGGAGAGAIAALSDGVLHYYLGGTADAALDDSPFKNVVAAMLDLADEVGAPLNLGGGLSPGDGLEGLQARVRQRRAPLRHPRGRLRPGRVRAALRGRGGRTGFFPAYRA